MTKATSGDCLDELTRAEDILLGSLGYGEGAQIKSLTSTEAGYSGTGVFPDGEKFEFSCEEELDDLQRWAISIWRARSEGPIGSRS
jgi:hypothetical protein